ncbi:MAG: hypothetical protein ACI808_002976, partial [Paraglaciecola sp.]
TDVATVKNRRRLLSCGWFSATDESFASNDTLLIQLSPRFKFAETFWKSSNSELPTTESDGFVNNRK